MQAIDFHSPDAWDDTELIQAYDRAVATYQVRQPHAGTARRAHHHTEAGVFPPSTSGRRQRRNQRKDSATFPAPQCQD
eukprot:scaffold7375_cov82-Isochrysis_galbana.AAC.2